MRKYYSFFKIYIFRSKLDLIHADKNQDYISLHIYTLNYLK